MFVFVFNGISSESTKNIYTCTILVEADIEFRMLTLSLSVIVTSLLQITGRYTC